MIPLTETQLEAIRSPQDVITILRSVVAIGDQLFHPELNRIVARCVVVLEAGIPDPGAMTAVVTPAHHWDHASQTAGGYEPEPVESEE